MPPVVALVSWVVLLVVLLYFDPAKIQGTSAALWVPVIWMFIVGSRLPSQWIGGQVQQMADVLQEGNPLDRSVYFLLIFLAMGVLVSRSLNWSTLVTHNAVLIVFLAFTLMSFCWSDFPFIAFKRWFRDLGNYLVILVALSDVSSLDAVRTLLRRLCYLLVPLSVLLVKYYPEIGRQYDLWHGTAMYVGATTSKNMLGVLCLVSGVFFFWDTVTRWPDRRSRKTRLIIAVNCAFIAMTFWLLSLSNSATSRVCLLLGCIVILSANSKASQRHPGYIKALIPLCFCLYLVLAFGFGINAQVAGAVGRDPTLTDRTRIWTVLLGMDTNSFVGTGYESFWLGPRLQSIWREFRGLNEAHNGYLEVYLNLGIAGLFLLGMFLVASYRSICGKLTPLTAMGSLGLALWTILLFYNVTEAAFKSSLLWITFLMVAITVIGPNNGNLRSPSSDTADTTEKFSATVWE